MNIQLDVLVLYKGSVLVTGGMGISGVLKTGQMELKKKNNEETGMNG